MRALRWVVLTVGLLAASATARAAPKIAIGPQLPLGFEQTTTGQPGDAPGVPQFGVVEVRNTGTTKLQVTRMEITGQHAAIMGFNGDFDPFCGSGRVCRRNFTLDAGQSRLFQTVCTPTRPGVFSASFTVTSNVPGHHTTVAMSCLGNHPPVITVAPTGLDFGTVHYCFFGDLCGPGCATAPPTQTLTITNSAPVPSVFAFYFTGIDTGPFGDFTMTPASEAIPGNPRLLMAGQSATFTFNFHPRSSVGIDHLQLVSVSPGPPPVAIPFHARGGSGRAELDPIDFPASLEYGQTFVRTLTGHNVGDSCLEINRFSASEMCSQVESDSYPRIVPPGGAFDRTFTCTLTLNAFPSAQFTIETPHEGLEFEFFDASVEPFGGALLSDRPTIDLTGPLAVPVGSSATVRLDVSNYGVDPTDLLTITSTDPQLTATPVAGSLPLTLAVGDTVPIDVTFTPTGAGRTSGTITFEVSVGMGLVQPVLGDGVAGLAGQPSTSTRQLAITGAEDPALAASGVEDERAASAGCQTGGGGGLALIAGVTGLLVRRRRVGRLDANRK